MLCFACVCISGWRSAVSFSFLSDRDRKRWDLVDRLWVVDRPIIAYIRRRNRGTRRDCCLRWGLTALAGRGALTRLSGPIHTSDDNCEGS